MRPLPFLHLLNIPGELDKNKENIKLQRIVLIVAFFLLAIKLAAWFYTGSLAILTDALESIVNVLAGALGLYSLFIVAKPRDRDHPYGHGKAEYVSAAAEGVFILLAGIYIIYEAVRSFFEPHHIEQLHIGIVLMGFTAVVNFVVGHICIKKGKENGSFQLIAAGKHLKTDTISTVALVLGLLLIYFTGYHFLDGIIALVAAIFILVTGSKVLRGSIGGMMDQADETMLKRVVALLNENRRENWIDIHNMRIIRYGETLHCDCHLTVPWYLNVREAHREMMILRDLISREFGRNVEMFVHIDPCEDYSCRICFKKNCLVRKHPFEKKIDWTLENVIRDEKHRLESS